MVVTLEQPDLQPTSGTHDIPVRSTAVILEQ